MEAVGQRALTSKTQIDVIARCFNWLVWLLAALNMLQEAEVGFAPLPLLSLSVGDLGCLDMLAAASFPMHGADACIRVAAVAAGPAPLFCLHSLRGSTAHHHNLLPACLVVCG